MRSPDLARAVDLPRSFTAWALAHGLQRSLIQRGARKGDLISRMVMDPALRVDPFPAYEELRGRGVISANDLISSYRPAEFSTDEDFRHRVEKLRVMDEEG